MDKDLKIKIKIDSETKEVSLLNSEVNKLGKALSNADSSANILSDRLMGFAKSYIGFEAITSSVGSFIRQADQMTQIYSKLDLVTSSTQQLTIAQGELFKIAQNSRVAFADTVDLYSRLARSTDTLGLTQGELLGVTDTISKAMVISGGSAESMNAALMQLGQGFASGTLRGEELNSVMEQTPRLATAIADGMGVSVGELRKLGEAGKLTAKSVMDALKSQAGTINGEFLTVQTTVSQSMTQASNSVMALIGDFDKALGISKGLAKEFTSISNSLAHFGDKFKDVAELSTIEQLNTRVMVIAEKIARKKQEIADIKGNLLFTSSKEEEGELRRLNQMLIQANAQYGEVLKNQNSLGTTKKKQDKKVEPTKSELTLEKQWQSEKQKLIESTTLSTLYGYEKELKALEFSHNNQLEKYKSISSAKAIIDENYESNKVALNEKYQKEADKDNIEKWNNYANLMSKLTEKQLDDEIEAQKELDEKTKKATEKAHKDKLDEYELNNLINSAILDTATREELIENNRLLKIKEELDYKLEQKEITQETYDKSLQAEKTLSQMRKKEISDKKYLNSTAGQFMSTLTGDSMKQALAGSLVDALQNGSSVQQAFAKTGISMGGNTLAMGMATGNVGMMGAGLAMGAVGALLEKPQETLISQENFLEKITAYQASILEETKAFRILNKIFNTDYTQGSKTFMSAYGSGYVLNTKVGEDVQNYIESLYSQYANESYNIKVGERTVQKTKSGFLGIGASSSTQVQDIWKTMTGDEVKALQFLSQFGINSDGSLTADGLSGLTKAFNSWSDLVQKLDDYAPLMSEIEKISRDLERIDTNDIKDRMYQTYSNQLANVGINLAEITIDNIDDAFNETTLGELIKNDPSLNVNQLLEYVNELNDAYLSQIDLTKKLSDAKLEQVKIQREYQEEINGYEDDLRAFGVSSAQSFVSAFDTILNSIKSIKSVAKETIASIGSQDVSHFWDLNKEFQDLLNAGKYDEANSVFNAISGLGKTLSQDNTLLNANLSEYLQESYDLLSLKENTTKVEIVGGLGELLGLTDAQTAQLKEFAADGTLTDGELSLLALGNEQLEELRGILSQTGLLGSESDPYSLQQYAKEQLAELKDANTKETSDLSVGSFEYLDYIGKKEQYDIAKTLGKSFKDVEEFIFNIQAFDIKTPTEDLEHLQSMLNYSFDEATGKISYDQTAVTDLSKLWDVLPQDVKDAYGEIQKLATKQQSEYLSGRQLESNTLQTSISTYTNKVDTIIGNINDLIDANEVGDFTGIAKVANMILEGDTARYTPDIPLSKLAFEWVKVTADTKAEKELVSYFKELSLLQSDPLYADTILNSTPIRLYKSNGYTGGSTNITASNDMIDIYKTQYNDLLALINAYQTENLPSFNVGSSYISSDMTANIHKGEMIIDPQSSEVLRKYGINVSGGVDGALLKAVQENNRLLTELLKTSKKSALEITRANKSENLMMIQGAGV